MCIKKIKSWWTWWKRKVCRESLPQDGTFVPIDIGDFIEASIVGIVTGIRKTQKTYANENSAFAPIICPAWLPEGSTREHSDRMDELEFDLAIGVTTTASSKVQGQNRVIVGVYSGDAGAFVETARTLSKVNRIRFKIPIRYPLTSVQLPVYDKKDQ